MTGLAIFLGGGVGALLRWMLSNSTAQYTSSFPLGVLICNLVGCFLIGLFSGVWEKPTSVQIGLMTGLLGGFTTFSTFSLDTLKLIQSKDYVFAFINSFGSLVFGLLLAWIGYSISQGKMAN